MSTAQVATLSLEAGAAHLESLLRQAAPNLPPALQHKLYASQAPASLSALFPGEPLHEEWKYTPLSILRTPWSLGEAHLHAALPVEMAAASLSHQPIESSPALQSLPIPSSPWEVLIFSGAASLLAGTVGADGFYGFTIEQSVPYEVAPLLYNLHVPSGVRSKVFLNTAIHSEGLLLMWLHVAVEAGAQVVLYHGAPASPQGSLLLLLSASVEREASLVFYSLPGRYRWVRTESRIALCGSGSEVLLYGAHTTRENEVCDTAIRVAHLAPHTRSNQLFRSIAFRGGRRIFMGRIHVAREGQRTNAYQSHKALLWEPGAEVYSRPQLEIFADDVRCTHGVTTGFLQGEMLHYLRSRGIPEKLARALIAEGFLMEALESIPTEAIRMHAQSQLALSP